MVGKKIVIVGLSFLLMAGLLSPLAAGDNDSLHVIMTVEDRHYGVEDSVNVQLLIYDKGVPVNLADINDASVGVTAHDLSGAGTPSIPITLTNQATGIYRGSYTVRGGDANRVLLFSYHVTVGNDWEQGSVIITPFAIADTVDVTVGGQKDVPARPGDVIKATALVRTGSVPISVSGFTEFYARSPEGLTEALVPTERETGVYDAEFTVPEVARSGTYEIVARPAGIDRADTAYLRVNVLDVWCHRLSASTNTVTFELCVADSQGAPVEGANFNIVRHDRYNDTYYGVTNATGKSVVYAANVMGAVQFTGYVLADGKNQTVEGVLINRLERNAENEPFDIIWEGTETVFRPNTQVTVPYGAYINKDNTTIPSPSKTVYYYVTAAGTDFAMFGGDGNHVNAPREVVATGSVTTNELGKFTIAFKTPARQSAIHIRLESPLDRANFPEEAYDLDDGIYYASWPLYNSYGFVFHAYEGRLDGDKGVSLSIGSFKPGKAGKITVGLDAEPGEPVLAFWGVGPASLDKMDSYDPEWMSWVPAGNIILLQENDKGKLEGEFLVPEFIKGQDVTVATGYADSEGIPHFDVKTASPGSNIPWLWIIIIIVIIVVVIVIIAVGKQQMWF